MNQSFLCGSIIACLCSILLIHILYLQLCEQIKLQIVLTCIEVDFMQMIATNLSRPILIQISDAYFHFNSQNEDIRYEGERDSTSNRTQ